MHDGRLHYPCARGLMEIMSHVSGILEHSYSSLVTLSRNKLLAGFLRLPCEWAFTLDSDIGFDAQDFACLMELQSEQDFAACGVYSRKDASRKPIVRGLGFARIHRSVIELMYETIAVPFEQDGIPMRDCFISGATSAGGFIGEDAGFWWMVAQMGVVPRIEHRCKLVHWGTAAYQVRDKETEFSFAE